MDLTYETPGVEHFCVDPRFHILNILQNKEIIQKIPAAEILVCKVEHSVSTYGILGLAAVV